MTVADFTLGTAAAATLLLPGWLTARAARVPTPLLGGFLASTVALTTIVLVLDAFRAPLNLQNVGGAWLIVTAAAAWWACRSRCAAHAAPERTVRWRENWPLLACVAPALGVAIYRASAQPLFGADTIFRWNYLAEQMLARASLAFYPPVSASDYEVYSWPDGIPPAISTLYFWCYAIGGAARTALTAPVVILQFCLVLFGTHAVARRWFDERAAAFACALLVTSPLVVWASVMGQETGLLAIAVAGLLVYLPRARMDEAMPHFVFAGAAAGAAALAREYGLVFPLLGLALGIARGLSPRGLVTFAATAALVALPWYVRNGLLTGNPLFNHSVGGLFPVNEVHAWLSAIYAEEFGWANLPPEAARLLVTNTAAVALAGAIGAALFVRRARGPIVMVIAIVALWAASVGHTAAGFIYSLRVLNPALVLAAALGGAALAARAKSRRTFGAAVLVLAVLGLDGAARALVLPANAHRLPPGIWLRVGNALHEYHAHPAFGDIARIAGDERILVLGPNALLSQRGARTVPLWSPEVRFVFDAQRPRREIAARLRRANLGWVLLNLGDVNERFLTHSAFLRERGDGLTRVWADGDMALFRVNAPEP